TSGLGRIFRKINIWEYKSPEASLGYKEFHKGLTYAHLYVASSPENISYRDISVSFLRHAKPVKLMKMLLSEGYTISEYEPGIYHVSKSNTNKEDTKMGIYADYFNNLEELENANKEIKNQDEQIKNQDKTIKTLQKELKKTNKENSELKKKLLAIEKELSNIAVL
ncbi:MAG: hypothetical protein J5718_06530, partial [Lachnospiraceae bacterium]|nr:hypothetical protein [Lachnospiraceae bacterium]